MTDGCTVGMPLGGILLLAGTVSRSADRPSLARRGARVMAAPSAACAPSSPSRPTGTAPTEARGAGRLGQLLQHRLGAGDRVFARLLDIQRGDDTVIDDHRIALRADPHPGADAVEVEAQRLGEIGAAVAQHHD